MSTYLHHVLFTNATSEIEGGFTQALIGGARIICAFFFFFQPLGPTRYVILRATAFTHGDMIIIYIMRSFTTTKWRLKENERSGE